MKLSEILSNEIEVALQTISQITVENNCECFLIGATARDIIFQMHDLKPGRATRDVDFAVLIADWIKYSALEQSLLKSNIQKTKISHRYRFDSLIVDIVPFGEIENPKGQITWPDDGQVMSTVGFEDALQSSHKLTLPNSDREIRIASLAGLYLMKCISWNDRPKERSHDVFDMYSILNKYIDAGQLHRIYERDQDLLEIPEFTLEKASAALLGRDLKKLCTQKSLIEVKNIFQREIALADKSLFMQQLFRLNDAEEIIFEKLKILLIQL